MVYLDNANASPMDPRVLSFTLSLLTDEFGNPSSLHQRGLKAKTVLEEARTKITSFIHAEKPTSVLFTGSATQANNLGIRGTALRNKNKGTHLLMSATEHISVINPMKDLQKQGFTLDTIPVDNTGILNLEALKELLRDETTVVSVQMANDEIGTVQPISEIAEIVHDNKSLLHVNATAAELTIPIDVSNTEIDLLTLSSPEIYGPRGAASLYIGPGVKIQTVMPGGGQERGLWAGTENIFAIAGMGEAARLCSHEQNEMNSQFINIRDTLIDEILKIEESFLTGHPLKRLPNHASFRFSRIEGESILLNLDSFFDIQVATGSACSSQTLEPSHVLLAIGLSHVESHGSMIMALSRWNTAEEIPGIVEAVKQTVDRLRSISPL